MYLLILSTIMIMYHTVCNDDTFLVARMKSRLSVRHMDLMDLMDEILYA